MSDAKAKIEGAAEEVVVDIKDGAEKLLAKVETGAEEAALGEVEKLADETATAAAAEKEKLEQGGS